MIKYHRLSVYEAHPHYFWQERVKVYTGEIICSLDGELPATMSIDGKLLAYCNCEMKIVVWDVKSNQEICTSTESSVKIERIALSPDGKWLASYNQEQKIEIWSVL